MADGEQRLWELARGFQPSRILLTAVELGVFAALGERSRTSADLASALHTDRRATDRLMNALAVLGLLEKEGEIFRNGPEARDYLVPGKPGYVGEALMHAVNMWSSWSTLTEAVRAGTSVLKRDESAWREWVTPFIAAMQYNSRRNAPRVIAAIDLSGVRRLLDVGGGSAAYSVEFCRANPNLEAVVFDLPDVVPLTQRYIKEAGFANRIRTTAGDYNTDELGRDFDLAFLSAVIHSNSPDENEELFGKCWRALKPGGRIVVQDFIVDDNRTSPPMAAVFALNMLVATRGGDTYTQAEIEGWLEAAGLVEPVRTDPPEVGTALLMARKPAAG